jgi:tetratricopeptide (TPR) repeat protein
VDYYTLAEERISNPGLVAHNKATALYRLQDYRGAEAHYRRCLEDASGVRRAALLYDLGNCLLQQSRGADAKQLKNAFECYRQCLAQNDIDETLRADARHNLELAKLLWVRAKQSRPNKEPGTNPEDKDPPKQDPKPPDDKEKSPGTDPTPAPNPDPMGKLQPTPDPHSQPQPIPADGPSPPGKGQLPPVPEKDEMTKLLPEDAAAHLQRAAARILQERRRHKESLAPPPSRVIPDY